MTAVAAVDASQQLLTRFLQRESRRLLKPDAFLAGTATQPVASTSKLPAVSPLPKSYLRRRKLDIDELRQLASSLPWQAENNNPFQTSVITVKAKRAAPSEAAPESAASPSKWPTPRPRIQKTLQALYSVRQQKQLQQAARLVSQRGLQPNAIDSASTAAFVAQLLPSPAADAAIKKGRLARLQRIAKIRRKASTPGTPGSVNPSVLLRGPYGGRKIAFKGHAWERNKAERVAARRQKLEAMPARIAEFNKVSLSCLYGCVLTLTIDSSRPGPGCSQGIRQGHPAILSGIEQHYMAHMDTIQHI